MAGNLIVFFIYFPVPSLKKQTPFPGKRFQVCDVEKFLLAVRPAHCKTFLKSSPEGDLGGYSPKSPPVGDLHASGIFSRLLSLDSSQRNPSLRYGFLVRNDNVLNIYYPSIQFIRMMRFYHDGCAESIEPPSVQITKRMHLRAAEIKQHCLSFRMKIKRNEVKFFE